MVNIYICLSYYVKSIFYIWFCKFILKIDVLIKFIWLNFLVGIYMYENGYGVWYL